MVDWNRVEEEAGGSYLKLNDGDKVRVQLLSEPMGSMSQKYNTRQ